MTRITLTLAAALAISGCAAGAGYEYDYDPWLGPHGHHVGGWFDAASHRPPRPCAREAFRGPYDGGWRGPYVSGPHCADAGVGVPVAATVSDASAP